MHLLTKDRYSCKLFYRPKNQKVLGGTLKISDNNIIQTTTERMINGKRAD